MSVSPWIKEMQKTVVGGVVPYDFHMHTTWTDGGHSSKEMHQAAINEGLKAILFSEHARRTSVDWFPRFAEEIRTLPNDRCHALVGVETKVDNFDGELDTQDQIVSNCDLVMASVHRFPGEVGNVMGSNGMTGAQAIDCEMKLALSVLKNPIVDILGHPFGMSHRRFKVRVPDDLFIELIKKAANTGIALEVNPHYHPEPWKIIHWCKEYGTLFSLGSNAHNVLEVGRVQRVLEGRQEPWQL